MDLSTIIMISVSVIGTVAILALVLYGFSDIDRQMKKNQLLAMLDVAARISELEGRLSSGKLLSQEECVANLARYADAIREVERYGHLKTPL